MTNIHTTPHAKLAAPVTTGRALTKATRAAQLRKLLTRKSGATITQIQKSFSWQPHTARAAISRLRKAGDLVDRKESSRGSVYRILSAKALS
jgi:DNA-binding transcriptional regulator PaaX